MENINTNELNDEELNVVVGGSTNEDAPKEFRCKVGVFTNHVSKYAEGFLYDNFYLVRHDGEQYYYGRLMSSFEAETTFFTERKQVMRCVEKNGLPYTDTIQVSGDNYYLYRTKIG